MQVWPEAVHAAPAHPCSHIVVCDALVITRVGGVYAGSLQVSPLFQAPPAWRTTVSFVGSDTPMIDVNPSPPDSISGLSVNMSALMMMSCGEEAAGGGEGA